MQQTGEIILYQPDESVQLEVRLEEETVWLTQAQMSLLFETSRNNITLHIGNIFKEGELIEDSVCKESLLTASENQQTLLAEHSEKIDFFVRTSLPPVEGIFFEGQVFDAHVFVSDLIRSAKQRIVLIDNYIDDTVLKLLDKRAKKVKATIYTKQISPALQTDINLHNSQYDSIDVQVFSNAHDRFLMIDETVYHIGASLKDLEKKWFAFSKMVIDSTTLLSKM